MNPCLHLPIQKYIAQVLTKLFLNSGKPLGFYISLNMAISGNSAVDLLKIAFFSKRGTSFSAQITLSRSNSIE